MIALCKICKTKFYPRPCHVRRGWGVYCSVKCKSIGTSVRRQEVHCSVCHKVVLRTDFQMSHSKSGKYFCGKSCQTKWRNVEFSGQKHLGWKDGKSMYREILEKSKVQAVCNLCRERDKRVLAVHHIDKNRKNCNLNNLVWLCHNCHSIVHYDRLEGQKFLIRHNKG